MAKATFSVLSESDKKLVLETEPGKLAKLGEDDLLALHGRVRRARNKHTKLYRQAAASRVRTNKARANASKTHVRDRARAEVLEEALARVSRRLATVAHETAEELKASRLAMARGAKAKPMSGGKAAAKGKPAGSSGRKPKAKSPATKKAQASTKASGKRRQAKRDSR